MISYPCSPTWGPAAGMHPKSYKTVSIVQISHDPRTHELLVSFPCTPTHVALPRLDKRRFFTIGVGLFSGITTVLYPLSVVKTRQMAAEGVSGGLSGTKAVAATIWRQHGIRGFYKGFGTVVFGTIPGGHPTGPQ